MRQNMVEQRGLARTEKSGEKRRRDFAHRLINAGAQRVLCCPCR
jgi:hypothetical protein